MHNAVGCGTPYGYGYGGYAPLARARQPQVTVGASLSQTWDDLKAFGEKETISGLPNKWLGAGALAIAAGIWAYEAGYIGR